METGSHTSKRGGYCRDPPWSAFVWCVRGFSDASVMVVVRRYDFNRAKVGIKDSVSLRSVARGATARALTVAYVW
jgi:hypothetical protein